MRTYSQNYIDLDDVEINDKSQTAISAQFLFSSLIDETFTITQHAIHRQVHTIARMQRIPKMCPAQRKNEDTNFSEVQDIDVPR